MPDPSEQSLTHRSAEAFAVTRWSLVVQARGSTDQSRAALADLCGAYWYPLYAYVRRRGFGTHDAQDLTQAFMVHLLDEDSVARADQSRGRFRTYLLSSLEYFLTSQWRHDRAQKRGGGRSPISIDLNDSETRYSSEPADLLSPQVLYDRRWALTVLARVLESLKADWLARGKQREFAALQPALVSASDANSYAEIARELSMSESAVKVAVHRMRKQYRELLHQMILDAVSDEGEVEDEIRHLFRALAGG